MLSKMVVYFVFLMSSFLSVKADEVQTKDLESFFFTVQETKFVVHATQKEVELVKNIESFAREAVPKINNYFGYTPEHLINVVLEKGKMSANGFAHTFPYNKISMRLAQPIGNGYLSSSVNFYKKLFIHEYVHVLHLERTEGISKFGSKIFGTIARLVPQVVPRWFTEGVAMWAEGHFTNEGRLKSDYLNIEVANILKEGTCSDLLCLDVPGVYPYGALAYWAGGAFLKYIEDNNEGAIACIVRDNASFPTLSRSFKNCIGKSTSDAFSDFINSLNPYGNDDIHFQKGIAYVDGHVYYMLSSEKSSVLRKRNTSDNSFVDKEFPYFVEKLENIEGELILTVRSSLSSNFVRKLIKINSASLEKESELTSGRVIYKGTKSTENLEFFFDDKWTVKNSETQSDILNFTNYETLFSPAFIKDQSYFMSSSGTYYSLYKVSSEGQVTKINVKRPYALIGTCQDTAIYRHENHYLLADDNGVQSAKMKLSFEPNFIGGDASQTVVLADVIKTYKSSCLSQFFKKKPIVSFSDPLRASQSILENKSYSSLFELMPKYWFILSTVTEDDLQYYSVITSFEDPMKVNRFNLSLDYYSEPSDVGGNFSYFRSIGKFDLGFSYQKDFQKSSASSNSYEESLQGSLDHESKIKDYSLINSLYATHSEVKNFISQSTVKRVGVGSNFYRYAKYQYQFFNNYYLYASAARSFPKNGKDFNRYRGVADFKFDLYKDYIITLRSTYEHLDKDTFANGVAYGGGTVKSIHQSYGIPYSDILGNRIKTFKVGADFKVYNIKTGWGLVPIYLQSLSLLSGVDVMASDFIFLSTQTFRNEELQSIYYGAKIDASLFYRLPLSIEAVVTQTEVNGFTNDNFQLIFRSSYTY